MASGGTLTSWLLFVLAVTSSVMVVMAQDDFKLQFETGCTGKADIVFIVDASSSVKEKNFKKVLEFIAHIVEGADVDNDLIRFGMLSYSTDVFVHYNLNTYQTKDDLLTSIHETPYNFGSTNTAGGIKKAYTDMFTTGNGDRPDVPNFALVITDGQSNIQRTRTIPEADEARKRGIHIFGVGINLKGKIDELKAISNKPIADNMFLADDFAALNNIKKKVFASVCRAVVRVELPDPPTPPPPTLPPPRGDCSGSADIVFVVDTSGSVGVNNFLKVKDAMIEVEKTLDIDSGAYRVAMLTYSSSTNLEFALDEYRTRESVVNHTKKARYIYGSTNTAGAIRRMREGMFQEAEGDRKGIQDVCVLITDGMSNIDHWNTIPEGRRARDAGIIIIGLGIGLRDDTELRGVVGEKYPERMIMIDDFQGLSGITRNIIDPLCSVANPCSSNPCLNGGECIRSLDKYTCRCRKGYAGYNCEHSCKAPLDIVFVLESSNRVGETNFAYLKGYMMEMLRQVNLGACQYRIGIMKFGTSAMVQFDLSDYEKNIDMMEAVDDIQYTRGGESNIGYALRRARTEMFVPGKGDRKNVTDLIVLLHGGMAPKFRSKTLREARTAVGRGINIVPIGLEVTDPWGTIAMSTDKQRGYFINNNYATISTSVLPNFLNYIFEDQDQCANSPCKNGGRCFDSFGNFRCECAAGFGGPTCENRCFAPMDVALTVDVSTFMNDADLSKAKDFLKVLANRFGIAGSRTKVGVITYGRSVQIDRKLDAKDDINDLIASIDGISIRGGSPVTMDAIGVASEEFFSEYYGDRENIPNYMVLVTSGLVKSNFVVDEFFHDDYGNMHIYGVGMGLSAEDEAEINKIIGGQDEYSRLSVNTTSDDINDIASRIVKSVCDDPDQCDELPCQNGAECLDLVNDYMCKCPNGFSGKTCNIACNTVVDLIFILDSSGSVGRDNYQREINFMIDMLKVLRIAYNETRVGLLSFSNRARPIFYLDRYFEQGPMEQAVRASGFQYGETFTAEALYFVREYMFDPNYGDRLDVPNVVIIVTDGESNIENWRTLPEAQLLKDKGVQIYSVGIGKQVNKNELQGMASSPYTENSFHLEDFKELKGLSAKIRESLCSEVDMCNQDTDPCLNDGQCIDMVGQNFRCQCWDGFTGERCERDCSQQVDLAFLIDSSYSVGPYNFERQKEFVADIIKYLYIGQARVSVSAFSDETNTAFYFNQYGTKELNIDATMDVDFMPGQAYTADGLSIIRKWVYSTDNGDRLDVPDILVLVTDGPSNVRTGMTLVEANKTREYGIEIYGVAIGMTDTSELEGIVSKPISKHLFKLDRWEEMEDLELRFLQELCKTRQVIERKTTVPPTPEPTTPEPTTTEIVTQPPTPPPIPVCDGPADLVIALDASDGFDETQFYIMLLYIDNLLREIGINNGNIRVGVMTYGDTHKTNFDLDDYPTQDEVSTGLENVEQIMGSPDIIQLGDDLQNVVFTAANGDRVDAPNIVLFIVGTERLGTRWKAYRVGAALRREGVETVTLSIGGSDTDLWRLSGRDNTIEVADTDAATASLQQLKNKICAAMPQ